MKREENYKILILVSVIIVIGIFASCSCAVLISGANAYSRFSKENNRCFDDRTAMQYIVTFVRQNEKVKVCDFQGQTSLETKEVYDNKVYTTRIYYYDGWIYELFSEENSKSTLKDGKKVLKASGLEFKKDGSRLNVRYVDREEKANDITLFIRTEGTN